MPRTNGSAPKKQKWTVMVYMAAADEELERYAIRDIQELQKIGSTDAVNIVVQIRRRWAGYAERYRIDKGKSEFLTAFKDKNDNGEMIEVDTGKAHVLGDFLTWVEGSEYRADHYLLVLWGHAFGLGFGRDHGDSLTMPELASALKGHQIDILGANACAMSYVEAAYELRDSAKFLVAPEITMPFPGWPYSDVLHEIVDNPSIEPEELGKRIVDLFTASFDQKGVALTLLNLKMADHLDESINELARAVETSIRRNANGSRDEITDAFLDTAHGEVRPLIDLADLCERLGRSPDRKIAAAAAKLGLFLQEGDDNFIIKHRADPDFEGLHGVGIFAPSVTGAADLMRLEVSKQGYKNLQLAKKASAWARLVYEDLRDLLDPVNKVAAEFVLGTGATDRADRMGVAQLVVSVHHSFVKLEKTVTAAQETVVKVLEGSSNGAGAKDRTELVSLSRLGPPYLRLADAAPETYQASPNAGARMTAGEVTAISVPAVHQVAAGVLTPIAEALSNLESALANVEKTSKKVFTNARFGLGNPDVKSGLGNPDVKSGLGNPDVKSGLGNPDVKSGLGNPDVKSGLGNPDVKSGLGLLSLLGGASLNGGGTNGVASVMELYTQVAGSLQLLEGSLAKLEGEARSNLTAFSSGGAGADQDYRQLAAGPVKRSFRELTETVAFAKRIAVSVLAHPAYGLGPVSQSGGSLLGRDQLAAAGGLSPRVLRLL